MGNLTSQSLVQTEADKLTDDINERANLGDGSYEIAKALGICRDGVREIILQTREKVCHICMGKGEPTNGKRCEHCKGLGAV